jgi:hypothetical protein
MRRNLEHRLALAEISAGAISWVDRQAAHHWQSLHARIHLHELIRERFRVMGIDPALAATLRGDEEAVAQRAIPDAPELKAAEEPILRSECSNGDDGAGRVRAKIARMADQYLSGERRLDLANASLAELLGFCVAVGMERGDEVSGSAVYPLRA